MPEVTLVQALNLALRDSLRDDSRALVLGEDVGRNGGVFRVTEGLQAEFGDKRVFDTPLAESGIAGISIGLALAGWHPVAEMQFDGFSYPALDQVISHVAKYRMRSRGRMPVPLVIRIPTGGGIGGPEHHSESPDVLYAHTAGLKVVAPSGALDAYNLLVRSIADPDPVIFLEPKGRYWAKESGELTSQGAPLGKAAVLREGDHCTLIAWGASTARCLAAAGAAAEDGVHLEVVDVRSLVPLDEETILASVRKTGRAVVVHEAPITGGFGAEIVARIMEHAFRDLHAPALRVAGYDVAYPAATLEHLYLPSVDRILLAVQRTFGEAADG
jgi:2-oxoisovalerate dehydrogenase E1 component beta subunit